VGSVAGKIRRHQAGKVADEIFIGRFFGEQSEFLPQLEDVFHPVEQARQQTLGFGARGGGEGGEGITGEAGRGALAKVAAKVFAHVFLECIQADFARGDGAMGDGERPEAGEITLSHPRRPTESFRPDQPADAARLLAWFRPLWPENRPEPARVIRVPGQAMTDQEQPLVSINSMTSLADLSARMGRDLSIHRFRGNIWVEDWAPWAELGMIGQEITIGTARLRVEKPIGRCRATGANPETGVQDADTMAALAAGGGHTDFGVFARVIAGGTVRVGDEVRR